MQETLNFTSLAWWMNGLIFVFISYMLPKVVEWIKLIPFWTTSLKRKSKLKRLKQIKNIRFDETKILIEAIKAYSWMIVFILTAFIVVYSFSTESFLLKNSYSSVVMIIIALPIYSLEFMYLRQKDFYETAILSRGKLRITKRRREL